ncbi:MAG: hypothetical protein JWQ98_3614 [Chlorobi bacterium]|nr:hypothetical protein [Chlorobiota bacterium]
MFSEGNLDRIIRDAIAKGEFDNLPGKGKPQPIDDNSSIPEDLRAAYKILSNSGFVPEEVHLMKEVEKLRDELAGCTDEKRRAELVRIIREKQVHVNMMLERRRL